MKWVTRAACLAVSAAGLWLAFHKQPVGLIWTTLKRANPALFLAGLPWVGLTILFGAIRWHIVLRMTGCSSHFGATARTTLVGHLFSVVMFGALGTDAARTTLYSRWYRQPLPRVLLSVSLERILTLGGWGGLAALGMILALSKGVAASHGLDIGRLAGRVRPGWVALAAAAAAVGAWLALRHIKASGSIVGRAGRPFIAGVRQLAGRPGIMAGGCLLTIAGQGALMAISVFNLQAVCPRPIPWFGMLWVFPVIMFLSALPISAAGLGVRESSSVFMLGYYGIAAEDALAASLLTFTGIVLWCIPGAVILWREESQRKGAPRPVAGGISVVIPVCDEERELPGAIERLARLPEVREIIVVDGGSVDATRDLAARAGCRVLSAPKSRGGQMRAGAEAAREDVILFLHADSWASPAAGAAILDALRDHGVVGGGFWKVFRERRLLLRGARFKCASRLYLGGLILGDQGFFVRREELIKAGGVPDVPLMEEFELCRRLRKLGRLALADATVTTSARRFITHGIIRTYLRMWRLVLAHHLGRAAGRAKSAYNHR